MEVVNIADDAVHFILIPSSQVEQQLPEHLSGQPCTAAPEQPAASSTTDISLDAFAKVCAQSQKARW